MKLQRYHTGQYHLSTKTHICEQGQHHNNVYMISSGWIMLYKMLSDGSRQVIRYALPGDFICFQPNLSTSMHYSAQTLTPATVCVFSRENLLEMLVAHPTIAIQLAHLTAQELILSYDYLLSLGRRNAKERLAFLFLELFYRLKGRIQLLNDTIPLPMTQEDLADTLGLTLVHINRTLRFLREEKLIHLSNHKLTILNNVELARLADYQLNRHPQ